MKKTNLILAAVTIATLNLQLAILSGTAQYTNLLNFAGANGSYPDGSLISDGTFLYGMTSIGGINNVGSIFKIKPDGTGYAKILDFSTTANGRYPFGSLISDGGVLYGMAYNGGTNSLGTLFKIMPDGTGFVKLLDFAGAANGSNPYGSLFSDGTYLYGMTESGGTNDLGVVFKIKPDGTGFAKLMDFSGATNGKNPDGALISIGGILYGMTYGGGINDLGTIFKIMTDGSGYTKLLDFSGTANGSYPYGSLISEGVFLYGMTSNGGTNNWGTIFQIKTDGTGYAKLLDFEGANGIYPYGSLISEGGILYGMTYSGGTNSMGTIFKIMTDGTGFAKLLDFTGAANGKNPNGDLIFVGNFLYGMTNKGGTSDLGVVFKNGITTGMAENNEQNNLIIYPNPTSGRFIVRSSALSVMSPSDKVYGLEIYNMLGEKVYSEKILNPKPVVSGPEPPLFLTLNVPNGIYFLYLKTETGTATQKLIIY